MSAALQAIMTMREDLYKLYSKLDSEGIKLDALQAVWKSFVNLQDNLTILQSQVKNLVDDGERNNTLLVEQNDRFDKCWLLKTFLNFIHVLF